MYCIYLKKTKLKFLQCRCRCRDVDAEISKWPTAIIFI